MCLEFLKVLIKEDKNKNKNKNKNKADVSQLTLKIDNRIDPLFKENEDREQIKYQIKQGIRSGDIDSKILTID